MRALSPRDDYPDSVDRSPPSEWPFNFHAQLEKPNKAFRAWIGASPRRSLAESAFAIARPLVCRRPRPTAPYETLLRRPRKGDVFFWTVELYELDSDGKRLGSLALLPRGVTVTRVAAGERDVAISLALDETLARAFGVGRTLDITATRDALRAMPRAWDVLTGKADHVAAFAKLLAAGGVATAGVKKVTSATRKQAARKAKVRATRPRATQPRYRALVVASLAKLRPALVSDLRRRVFVAAIPEGAKELAFEVHWRQLADSVPIVGYWMDGNGGQLGTAVAILPNKRVIAKRDFAPFVEDEVETLGVHSPLVLRWFVAAWRDAVRGNRFGLPASIQYHDGGRVIQLK